MDAVETSEAWLRIEEEKRETTGWQPVGTGSSGMFALNLIEPLAYGGLGLMLPVPLMLVVLKAVKVVRFSWWNVLVTCLASVGVGIWCLHVAFDMSASG
jgi:hypothetical protein